MTKLVPSTARHRTGEDESGGRDAGRHDPRSAGAAARPGCYPRGARVAVWLLLVAVLTHTFLIAAWVGPNTPVRQAIGAERLRSYVVPVFEQSWMIFAPTPRRVAVNLQVRAEYIDPATGELEISAWVDLVDGEDALIAGNPFPPRMSLAARRVANTLNATMGNLNEEQVALVAGNYLTTPVSVLGERMVDAGDASVPVGTVGDYMTYDQAASHLATAYCTFTLGAEVTQVQYRTGMRYVPSYDSRSDTTLDEAEITWFSYGWRPATPLSDQELELFAPYVQMSAP